MNRTQFFKKLRGLNLTQLRELSEERSCHAYSGGTPEDHAHERLLFCSGFRKGVKAGLRGDRSVERGERRKARGRRGDAAWALGYARGIKYVPDVLVEGLEPRKQRKKRKRGHPIAAPDGLTDADLRRLKRRGRA